MFLSEFRDDWYRDFFTRVIRSIRRERREREVQRPRPTNQPGIPLVEVFGEDASALLAMNRVQKQSRIVKEINKDPYRPGELPTTSIAAKRLEKRSSNSAPPRECAICLEDMMDYRFPDKNIRDTCKHERGVCLNCISKEIRRTLDNTGWTEARCITCQNVLEYKDIEEYAYVEDFGK